MDCNFCKPISKKDKDLYLRETEPTTNKECAELHFPGIFVAEESETVTNPFSGESVELEPEAVAVYDLSKGSEMFGDYELLRKCLDWFIEHYPKEYMVLLD